MPDESHHDEVADERRLCPACGVMAPAERRSCEWCEAPLDRCPSIPDGPDGIYPVVVCCHFQCRSCGHRSPLNELDLDGTVRCLRCGLDQMFDVSSWAAALDHAHGVGDLAGPSPEGRHPHPRISIAGDNPLASIGRYRTSARLAQSGTRVEDGMVVPRSLIIDAAPGWPLCSRCNLPLEIRGSDGHATTSCPDCGRSASYDIDPRARQLCSGLIAAVAEDQRTDRLAVQVTGQEAGEASVLRCPGCGAAMSDVSDAATVRCEFCNTVARIPAAVRQELFDHEPDEQVWWLLFGGPSKQRRALEDCDDLSDAGLAKLESPPWDPAPLVLRLALGTLLPVAALILTLILLWGTRIPPWLF